MLSKTPPEDFQPKFEIAGCFVQTQNEKGEEEMLLLLRQDGKPQANTWGIPAGKLNPKEDRLITILRELEEETGLRLDSADVQFLNTLYDRFEDVRLDFVWHVYRARLATKPLVTIKLDEHKDFRWVRIDKALELPLIEDLDACMQFFRDDLLS